ncbi:hypothetical protein AB0N97_31715 [Streptomyces collinus]|uniref:Uncharacterized protein n=1 Tax=Streptomyces violaceochromogenes TaxID=67377 RepID=A0ABU6M0E5_9ACTN|nr:hypothetical protein [Streptomyces violaceochromogenes]MEC7055240.1 hypothetical protein [Streptomyces violaceochromogenes]GHC72117.1 hypothetical protein GCM10010309_40950 [Streptomyces violaceochromogenes]
MAVRAVARAAGGMLRRWLGRGRWGWLLFFAGQACLGRDAWAKVLDGDPGMLGALAFSALLVGCAVWYRVRWARRARQAGSAGEEAADGPGHA